jgi:hypothetical protein
MESLLPPRRYNPDHAQWGSRAGSAVAGRAPAKHASIEHATAEAKSARLRAGEGTSAEEAGDRAAMCGSRAPEATRPGVA